MPELVLNVHDLEEGAKSYDFPLRGEWLASALADTDVVADERAPEGRFELTAYKQGADVIVRGRLVASLATECSRCLEVARIGVDADVTSLLTARRPELRAVPGELELTPEDLDREFFTGDTIVLDEVVREHLLLEVPIQPLCSDACPGIPVPAEVAGPADLRDTGAASVDPRFAPLLKLVGKTPAEE